MHDRPLRIGTRGSALALAQAGWVAARLAEAGHPAVLVRLSSRGDSAADWSQGPGLFTREIDQAVLEGQVDLGVHSLKDLPTALAAGLVLAAVPRREDVRDAVVSAGNLPLAGLPAGAEVGTISPRRRAWLRRRHPGLAVVPLRGNADTRIARVRAGRPAAALLAAAGLRRLGRAAEIAELLAEEDLLPAPGQGALALTARVGAWPARAAALLDDAASAREAACERAFLAALGAGCRVPLGARARAEPAQTRLAACVWEPEGRGEERLAETCAAGREADLGRGLAARLLAGEAGRWLARDCIPPAGR